MPNVIDSLVVLLGLDASQYRKASNEVSADRKKFTAEEEKAAKAEEASTKKRTEAVRNLRNEVAGLLLAFTGAATLAGFAKGILANDAAVGRFAANLGQATAEVSKWEAVVQRVGGAAGDADGAFRTLKGIFNDRLLTGNMGAQGDLAGLGITDINQLKNPGDALLKMAETGEHMDRSQFSARLGRLGISDSMITLLAKGRQGVADYLAEQEKLGHATDESSQAAQRLEDRIAVMESLLREKLRPALEWVVNKVIDWAGDTDTLAVSANALLVVLGGLSLWAASAAAPFVAIAGAIALVTSEVRTFKRDWANVAEVFSALAHGDFKGAWRAFQQGNRDLAGDLGFGGKPSGGAPKPASGRMLNTSDVFERLIMQESGGRAGIAGPMTKYGQAHGLTQLLDGTARQMAAKLGLAWQPELLRGTSAAAVAYQRQLGQAYYQEGLDKYGGDTEMALKYYHGGPNQKLWGTNTNAYARSIMGGTAGLTARGGAGGGSSTNTTSVGQIVVNVATGDPDTIAGGIRGAIAKRGLVVQSGSGMNP